MLEGACHCGKVKWTYAVLPERVLACNCTVCRRYGGLWAYGYLGEGISVSGPTSHYSRDSKEIHFHFCGDCGCVAYYLSRDRDENGRMRMAVNTRMCTTPEKLLNLPVDHFEGLNSFTRLPRDHRTVKDHWF